MSRQFIRFWLVGALNTAFGYALYAGLIWLGLPYPAATAWAYVGGVLFNFQTTSRMVFSRGTSKNKLAKFVAVYVGLWLLNVGALKLLIDQGLNAYSANALLILPLALLTYVLQSRFVYKAA